MASSTRDFRDLLDARWAEGRTVCVGLDPDIKKLPTPSADALVTFCAEIVSATARYAAAFKPNIAFFEQVLGGADALFDVISIIMFEAPEVPVILDIKRGDIGNTNAAYATAAFEVLGADAVTIHGYLGREAMQPFMDRSNKGVFVLCRTSNPGSGEFQALPVSVPPNSRGSFGTEQVPLYQLVAHNVATDWNGNNNCGLVVGATYPQELAEVRRIVGDNMPILVPGVGAQGGDLEATIKAGGDHILVNSSRGIIYAPDPEQAAHDLHTQIVNLRKNG